MSLAEIERFAADLKSNEALRAEAEKTPAETSQGTPMDHTVAFAATKGYAFTADNMKEYVKAKELTDAELVGVAGGVMTPEMMESAKRSSDVLKSSSENTSDVKSLNLFLQQLSDSLTSAQNSIFTLQMQQ